MCTNLFKPPKISLPPIPQPPAPAPQAPIAPLEKPSVSDEIRASNKKDTVGRFLTSGIQLSTLLGLGIPTSSTGLSIPGGSG